MNIKFNLFNKDSNNPNGVKITTDTTKSIDKLLPSDKKDLKSIKIKD